ncbi:MAG TPA: IS110 family transposase [Nocardioides sp.]|nr:IS110 family transposase [Nocardioides sp.]
MVRAADATREVTGGVDTHADTHTVAALDERGRVLGNETFPATTAGYADLLTWLAAHGRVEAVGIEGTGSYGAGLARYLTRRGITLIEVDRPDRRTRRRQGKSDPVDAIAAARAVQAGTATGTPKTRDGVVESIRALRVARKSAVKAHTAALNTLQQMVITAPDQVREQLSGLSSKMLVPACAKLRPGADLTDPVQATKQALRRMAKRCQLLAAEIAEADAELKALVNQTAPKLVERFGVGPEVAGQLLITAGDNPERLRSEASFAALCGVSPLPASSGRTDKHRLNRGGDRAANSALHVTVLVRMRFHEPTRAYVARRTAEGLKKPDIIRCLKRYLVREFLPLIRDALEPETPLEIADVA